LIIVDNLAAKPHQIAASSGECGLTPSQLASARRVIAEFTRMGWLYRVGSRNGRALWANDTPLNTTMRKIAKATTTLPQ
jgi:hypothetical protein